MKKKRKYTNEPKVKMELAEEDKMFEKEEDEIEKTVRDILDTTKGKTIVKNREFNVGCCSDVSFEKIVFKGCRDDVLYFDIK